jgi:hypothetical protein
MAVTDAQKVDYLWKKVGFGVAKTDTAAIKSASNEANASPLLIRGDTLWVNSDLIPATAPSANTTIVRVYSGTTAIQMVNDATSSTNRTWVTNLPDWISSEFGSTYQPRLWAAPAATANAAATGTRLFPDGSGNADAWFFDPQAGLINFDDTNVPTAVAGNVVFIEGYRYIGLRGVSNISSSNFLDNITISTTTISTDITNGNIYLAPTGTGMVQINGTNAFSIPVGNTAQQPNYVPAGSFRYNSDTDAPEFFNGADWVSIAASVSYQTFNGNSTGNTFPLNQATTTGGVLVNLNGVQQTPNVAYAVANSSITFAEIPLTTDVIDIRYISTGQSTSNYGNASVAEYLPTYTGNLGGTVNGYSIGYRDIPQLSTGNANITLSSTDSGKHYLSTTAAANIIYLPTNAAIPLSLGAVITVVVQGTGSVQIVANSGVTLYMGGNATSGSNIRTISSYGVASVLKTGTDTWFINGTGVS